MKEEKPFIIVLSPWGNLREMCCDRTPDEIKLLPGEWMEEFTNREDFLEFAKMTALERLAWESRKCNE